MSGLRVAHGVMTEASEIASESVAVDATNFLRDFLSGKPILYQSFLSTTTDFDAAMTFTAELEDREPMTELIDMAESSPRTDLLRRSMIEHLQSDESDASTAAIVVILDCGDVKGALLGPQTTGQGFDEKEILFGPGHVMWPLAAIHGPNQYVLHAKLTALNGAGPELGGRSARYA